MLFLAAYCTVSAQTNAEAFRPHPNQDDFAPVHAHQAEMSLACATAMTNILKDIADVAPEVPPLSEIRSASIEAWGSTDAPTYMLYYKKNAHFVSLLPLPTKPVTHTEGYVTNTVGSFEYFGAAANKLVIDSGGMDLEIVLADAESQRGTKANGKFQYLLKVNGWPKFTLCYYVSFNASDARLEKTINGIVETNVALLSSHLQKITGLNPNTE